MSAETWKPSPIVQFALSQFLGSDPKQRADIAELVCDTLGVLPRFWRVAPEAPPVNVGCIVKCGELPGGYTIASWDGVQWLAFNGSAVQGVTAWAAIPD